MNIRSIWDQVRKPPHRTIVLLAVLGIAIVALIIPKGQEEKEDRPLLRLDEIQGGKTPPVLFLSGKFTEAQKGTQGSSAPRSGEFEMYIRGTDYYFLKCWRGNPTNRPGAVVGLLSQFLPFIGRKYSGWSLAAVVEFDFGWRMSRQWGRFGARGGGGSYDGSLAPGRRLWNHSGFIGAIEEGQVNTNKPWDESETYKDLMKVGAYRIPQLIEFKRGDYSQTFRVKKCEFRDGPSSDWFVAKMKEISGGDGRLNSTTTNAPTAK